MSILKSTKSGAQYAPFTIKDALEDGWEWYIKNIQIKRKINTFERIMDVIYTPESFSEPIGKVSYTMNLFHDLQYKFKIETFGDYFLLKKLFRARTKKNKNKLIVKILENEHSERSNIISDFFFDPKDEKDIIAQKQKEKKEDIEKFKFFNGIGL